MCGLTACNAIALLYLGANMEVAMPPTYLVTKLPAAGLLAERGIRSSAFQYRGAARALPS